MIVFKKVRWKNFLSTGNNFIEVGLDKNHTTLVVGENGAGKSTILDALSFSLFNRPFRSVKKEQLINSINFFYKLTKFFYIKNISTLRGDMTDSN